MKSYLLLIPIVFVVALLGCISTKSNTVIVDGITYTQIRQSHTNMDGIVDAALYTKPGVTDRYYTPSIRGNSMISLSR